MMIELRDEMERRGLLEIPGPERHYRSLMVDRVYKAMDVEGKGGDVGGSQTQEGSG